MWEVNLDNYNGLTCQNHWPWIGSCEVLPSHAWHGFHHRLSYYFSVNFYFLIFLFETNWNQTWKECLLDDPLKVFFFYVDRKYSKQTRGPKMIKRVFSVFNLCLWNQLANWNQTRTKPKKDKRPKGVKKCVVCFCMWSFIFKPLLKGWFFLYVPY